MTKIIPPKLLAILCIFLKIYGNRYVFENSITTKEKIAYKNFKNAPEKNLYTAETGKDTFERYKI